MKSVNFFISKLITFVCIMILFFSCAGESTAEKNDAKADQKAESKTVVKDEDITNVKVLQELADSKNAYSKLSKIAPPTDLFKVFIPKDWVIQYDVKSGLIVATNPKNKGIEMLRVIYRVGGEKENGMFQNPDLSYNVKEFAQSQLDMFERSKIKFTILENDNFANCSVGQDGSLYYTVDAYSGSPKTYNRFIIKTNGFDACQFSYTSDTEFTPDQVEMFQEIANSLEYGDNIKYKK